MLLFRGKLPSASEDKGFINVKLNFLPEEKRVTLFTLPATKIETRKVYVASARDTKMNAYLQVNIFVDKLRNKKV